MKICFYAAGSIPIHARSLDERPLGGTETGLIRVAEVLSKSGHEVVVVSSHPNAANFNISGGPLYVSPEGLLSLLPVDAFVAVQFWKPLFLGFPAKRHFFWTGDGYQQFSNWGIGDQRVMAKIEKLFAVSSWHAETLSAESGFPKEKISVVGNGIHPQYFAGEEIRNPRRLIYTSAPYRGLDLAARYFHSLRSEYPGLELHVFAGLSIYDRESQYSGPHAENFREMAQALQKIPGIVLRGNIRQQELSREYMKAAVLVYPNTVEETFCITALEALAGGCPVVASANSALPQTVGDGGYLISGQPGSPQYSTDFMDRVRILLSTNSLREEISKRARNRVLNTQTWDHVAARIEREL